MGKNYFTDEQIKEIYYSEAGDSIESGAFEFYKGLFNKAVETAIGEPVAYRHLHEDGWEYYDAPTGSDCSSCKALFTTPQPAPSEDDVRDAERYRWLVADHDNKDTRQKCRDLLSRLGVMSYSAASSEIDQAIAQEVK